ncbi:hypothetical protein [Pectinatus frisingensis]|uniref:hypothetical protein n=2 Tax=Pectinatus frisingensis TaxID=865 RepID=UPI0018C7E27F|nr:hypothetical protein [Pectinatus frisingensis]
MYKIISFWMAFLFILGNSLTTAAAQPIPDDIYQWVQASPRIGYYFNKAEMKYAVGNDGLADTNILEVPILEQYDWIEMQDVVEKRRWNDEDLSGFDNLWGYAGILHIDTKARIVTYVSDEYLNIWWSPISTFNSNRVDSIDKMSAKNLDRTFYESIIAYANDHRQELLSRQRDQISPAELKAAGLWNNSQSKEQSTISTVKTSHTEQQKVQKIIKSYEKTNTQNKSLI